MSLTKQQLEARDRAMSMAESWANDPERLAGLMTENMTTEQYAVICGHLAKCFVALTNDSSSREACKLELLIQIGHIHAEVVENIFLPVAEKLVHIDAMESLYEAADRRRKEQREEALIRSAA